jgi:hypothetical protein
LLRRSWAFALTAKNKSIDNMIVNSRY